jgi:beta-phosphoglucomutase-like phosphatase (HAD superfamily)
VQAGVAAGATVWALCTSTSAQALRDAGASALFDSMHQLPGWWASGGGPDTPNS